MFGVGYGKWVPSRETKKEEETINEINMTRKSASVWGIFSLIRFLLHEKIVNIPNYTYSYSGTKRVAPAPCDSWCIYSGRYRLMVDGSLRRAYNSCFAKGKKILYILLHIACKLRHVDTSAHKTRSVYREILVAGIAKPMTRAATMTQCCCDLILYYFQCDTKSFLCDFRQTHPELCLKLLWHNFSFAFFLFFVQFLSPAGCMFIIC